MVWPLPCANARGTCHSTAPRTGTAQHAAPRKPATASSPLLAALQHGAGNAVVSRLVQRKEIGPQGGKTWYSTGNFDAKHLITGSLDEEAAKARYTERYNKRPSPMATRSTPRSLKAT